ncbi:MAG: hypothetical protein ACOY9J_03380 [Pseudomonadota bacterium]
MQQDVENEPEGRCEPAYSLIRRLGGYAEVAAMVRRHGICQARAMNRSGVYRWQMPREAGGQAGVIPAKHWAALIKGGAEIGVKVTVWDLSPRVAEALEQAEQSRAQEA